MSDQFADRLTSQIEKTGSILCVGLDPIVKTFPAFFQNQISTRISRGEDRVQVLSSAIFDFYSIFIEALYGTIACIKPNIAFFEQYGLGGLIALTKLAQRAKELSIPIILDGKRGDIGSTAQAYAKAFLGCESSDDYTSPLVYSDSLTVNPFLGFDTLEPFVDECTKSSKGIFVLVRTSNPGAAKIQGEFTNDLGATLSEHLARWVGENSSRLTGASRLSGLGAVVGATQPQEAVKLRSLMPNSYFLVPGFGAQGASAAEAVAGRTAVGTGVIVNVSRAMTTGIDALSPAQIKEEVLNRAKELSTQLRGAIS